MLRILTTIALCSLGLTPAPAGDFGDFTNEIVDIEIAEAPDGRSTEFIARDASGAVIGTLALVLHEHEIVEIHGEFDDGAIDIVTSPFGPARIDLHGITAIELGRRLDAINEALDKNDGYEQGWLKCGLLIAGTVAACAAAETGAGAVACVAGAGMAACECLPLASEEFEDIEC